MDSYKKLIEEITGEIALNEHAIKNKKEEIEHNASRIKFYSGEREKGLKSVSDNEKILRILTNYEKRLKTCRNHHIHKGLQKIIFVILILIAIIATQGLSAIIVTSIISLIATLGIVMHERSKFEQDMAYDKSLKEQHTIEKIENEIENINIKDSFLIKKINSLINVEFEVKSEIEKLYERIRNLHEGLLLLQEKRSIQVEQLIEENEDKLDLAFASDSEAIEVLKLERTK